MPDKAVVVIVVRYNELCQAANHVADSNRLRMPLTVFDCKGISATPRARIEGAGGRRPESSTTLRSVECGC
jgi:hypothetical protein